MTGTDQLRCINKQCPSDMNEACKIFWPSLVTAIQSLRSAVSKNSLIFITELFNHSKDYQLYDEIILGIAPEILAKCFNDKKFIKREAEKAVDAMVSHCLYDSTYTALCIGCLDKNAKICELSMKALGQLVKNTGDQIVKLKEVTFQDLVITLAKVISWPVIIILGGA